MKHSISMASVSSARASFRATVDTPDPDKEEQEAADAAQKKVKPLVPVRDEKKDISVSCYTLSMCMLDGPNRLSKVALIFIIKRM